jgi:hypothetical protein
MRLPAFLALALMTVVAPLSATDQVAVRTVTVAPMKTSIYVGSVRLNTGVFTWQGEGFATTYEAKVVPWIFWGETGNIVVKLSQADLVRLTRGETIEFTGDATNHKNKPRSVTGRAQPATASTGKIKVRIMADGIELIFNSTYEFTAELAAVN